MSALTTFLAGYELGNEYIFRVLRRVRIKDLIYKRKDILGLDVGTSSVKFVQLKQSGKLTKLVGYGRIEIPENIIVEGIISEPEKLANILKKSLNDPPWGRITAQRVIASLPESKIFTKFLELPGLEDKDIEEAINYEMEQSIPIAANDLYVDWQELERKNNKRLIFLSAAPKSIVNSYVQLFELLDIEPVVLEMSLAAIARSMVSNKEKVEPVAILDIGGEASNVAIFDSNLRITGSHAIGGKTIRDLLIKSLGITEKEAFLAIRKGIKGSTKGEKIIKEEIEKLAVEVERTVKYFSEKNESQKVTKGLLCGGLAFAPGFYDYLSERTKLEFKIGNPWVNISVYPIKPVPKEESPGYAAAIGLCLRGFDDKC